MAKMKLKKGDRVKVIAGKDKGAVGEIIAVFPERARVTVQGVNIVKRHQRDTGDPATGRQIKGGIISREAPIHVSNVQLLVKDGGRDVVTRIGSRRVSATKRRPDGSEYDGTRGVRIARKTGEEI
ncbi:50S ribosomal protein L24 [uncultured Propionibacterium sp.]|uniref:50S ribosomal protein L24 n=1 Tax=uncultured Propionibacterium sp. TaxID=218066 RepID=UPI00292F1445|nr:50S ribosomal protein L24 [uncultured Propionibacterium sp.]